MVRTKSLEFDAEVRKTKFPKCPRCYRHTPEGIHNFDHLCDRCCTVLIKDFPDHWSVPEIKIKIKEFRAMTPEQRVEINRQYEPERLPEE